MQRKVFRVERMFGGRAAARPMGIAAPDQVAEPKATPARAEQPAADRTVQSLKRELALLHDAIARNKRELAVLIGDMGRWETTVCLMIGVQRSGDLVQIVATL